MGDEDAEDLGVITFNPEGNQEDCIKNISIPARLRQAGIKVSTEREKLYDIPESGKEAANNIVQEYAGLVFTDRIGNMKIPPVTLQYYIGFRPTQPQRYPVPYHYQDKLTEHLAKLKEEGIIEVVNPAKPVDCILNLKRRRRGPSG